MINIAVALVAAHIITDFGIQGSRWVAWKAVSLWGLLWHAVVYGALTWLLLPTWSGALLLITLGLALIHGLLDLWKARAMWPHRGLAPLQGLLLDQFAHLLMVAIALGIAARLGVARGVWAEPWSWLGQALALNGLATWIPRALTLVAAYVLAVPGGSVIVRSLLEPYTDALPSEAELSLGSVIGYLERLILLTLLLLGEYAAMAVIVAAKSLIRIPTIAPPPVGGHSGGTAAEGEARRLGPARFERITTEYFLIGTLASISVALFTGLLARWTLSLF